MFLPSIRELPPVTLSWSATIENRAGQNGAGVHRRRPVTPITSASGPSERAGLLQIPRTF